MPHEFVYRKHSKIVKKNYSSRSCEIFLLKKQCLVFKKKVRRIRRRRRGGREIKINILQANIIILFICDQSVFIDEC